MSQIFGALRKFESRMFHACVAVFWSGTRPHQSITKRRGSKADGYADGRLKDVNMNSRGLLSPRSLTSAQ